MTKKVLAVSLILCVMFAASSAIAQPRRPQPQTQPQMQPRMPRRDCNCPQGWQGWSEWNRQPQNQNFDRPERSDRFNGRFCASEFEPRGYNRDFNPRFDQDMPKEIRALAVEAAKLRIDLNEALNSDPIEKEKAIEIYDKIMKLEQDIERWRFTKKIDRIEAFRKQHELNRNFRPAPPAPQTEPEAPKPENTEEK